MNVSSTTTPGNSALRSVRKCTSASLASNFTVTGVTGSPLCSSRCFDPLRALLVVLGGLEVLRPGQDLERPQAEEEDGEGHEDEEAKDPDPEDHLRGEAIRRLGARVRREETAGAKACAGASQRTPPPGAPRRARRACGTGRTPGTPGSGSAPPRAAAHRRARPSRTRGHRA